MADNDDVLLLLLLSCTNGEKLEIYIAMEFGWDHSISMGNVAYVALNRALQS